MTCEDCEKITDENAELEDKVSNLEIDIGALQTEIDRLKEVIANGQYELNKM